MPRLPGLAVDAPLEDKAASKPGVSFWPGMSLADTRLLARWCPAWRRREPDLRLSCGTWECAPRYRPAWLGSREFPKRLKREGQSTVAGRAGGPVRSSGDVPAWCGGGGAKGPAYPWFACMVNQDSWEESRGRAETAGQAVRDIEAGGMGCLAEGESQWRGTGSGRAVDRGFRGRPEEQSL